MSIHISYTHGSTVCCLLYCLLFLLYLHAILCYYPLLYALCYRFVLLGASVAVAFSLMRLPNVTHTRPYTHIYTRTGTYMHIHSHIHRYIFVYVRLYSYIQGGGAGKGFGLFVCFTTHLPHYFGCLAVLGTRGDFTHWPGRVLTTFSCGK